jgi:hypothetical protein
VFLPRNSLPIILEKSLRKRNSLSHIFQNFSFPKLSLLLIFSSLPSPSIFILCLLICICLYSFSLKLTSSYVSNLTEDINQIIKMEMQKKMDRKIFRYGESIPKKLKRHLVILFKKLLITIHLSPISYQLVQPSSFMKRPFFFLFY